ncbi:MAG: DUF5067 domain-containing protein [Coriobacteriales bacterium]|nr:DUF5067 domain-containing protein [Coriobacteriales bacterium]
MKKSLLSLLSVLLLALFLSLAGCKGGSGAGTEGGGADTGAAGGDAAVEGGGEAAPEAGAEGAAGGAGEAAQGETPAKPANFAIIVGEGAFITDDGGNAALRVDYELINKGETGVPEQMCAVSATQNGVALQASTFEGATGSIDYQVRGGGSVQCFAVFVLEGSGEVTVEFLNTTDPGAAPVQTASFQTP